MSPDGRRLAYAAPGPAGPDDSPRCCNTIVVTEIAGGASQRWRLPDGDAAGEWFGQASFTKLGWAHDSRRLAFTISYEGDTVAVLDVGADRDLSQATEVIVPGGGGDSRHPASQAPSGRLAVVNRAFECCFDDDYTGPPRTVLIDVGDRLVDDLLPSGDAPTWLDFDATGDHLLFVVDGDLYRRTRGEDPVKVADGVQAADW